MCFAKSCSVADLYQILEINQMLGWISPRVHNITLINVRILPPLGPIDALVDSPLVLLTL